MADNIRKAAEVLGDEARSRIEDVTEEALDKGRKTWKDIRDRGEEVLDQARQRGGEAWEDAQKLVRKYPRRAVGLALLAGAVFGALIAHSDDR
jgi:ElaB/YqjD/DUF883 family membrane-anchored ribosome-binding protein